MSTGCNKIKCTFYYSESRSSGISGSGKSNYPSLFSVIVAIWVQAVGTLILICRAAAKKKEKSRPTRKVRAVEIVLTLDLLSNGFVLFTLLI